MKYTFKGNNDPVIQMLEKEALASGWTASKKGMKIYAKVTYNALLKVNYKREWKEMFFRDQALYEYFLLKV